ncbi:MAG: hypothetical protein RL885_24385 [Planctomycetota bacterium]
MNRPQDFDVDAALSRLREDDTLERADLTLEARLRRRFRRRRSSNWLRRAAALLIGLGLTAAAVEATVGLDRLTGWWYSITIDGHVAEGVVPSDGERRFEYTTQDGCHVTVEVRRRRKGAHGTETGISVRREGPGARTEMQVETHETTDVPAPRLVPRTALEGATRLHDWVDPRGTRRALYWQHAPGGGGELLIEEVDSHAALPVRSIGQPELGPGKGTAASIVEDGDGGLSIELSAGASWRYELGFSSVPHRERPTELVTPDGKIKVEVGR